MPRKSDPKEEARAAQAKRDAAAQTHRQEQLNKANAPQARGIRGLMKPGKTLAEIIREAYPEGLIEKIDDNDNEVKLSLEQPESLTFTLSYTPETGVINLDSKEGTPLQIYQVGIHLALHAFAGRFEIEGPDNEKKFMLAALREVSATGTPEEVSALKSMIDKNQIKCNGEFVALKGGELILQDHPTRRIKPSGPSPESSLNDD